MIKNCSTCKYENYDSHSQPCCDCGTLLESFTRTRWEERKHPTNGDIIKSMFVYDKILELMYHFRIIANEGVIAEFDKVWWNAPYQKGGKE